MVGLFLTGKNTNMIKFCCPMCQQKIEAPDEMAHHHEECPNCGSQLIVPGVVDQELIDIKDAIFNMVLTLIETPSLSWDEQQKLLRILKSSVDDLDSYFENNSTLPSKEIDIVRINSWHEYIVLCCNSMQIPTKKQVKEVIEILDQENPSWEDVPVSSTENEFSFIKKLKQVFPELKEKRAEVE
jgi:DNA-directed RNA polymerase subunit RPC12/RpoP